MLELPEGTRFQVLAPVVRGRKGEYETLLDRARRARASPGPGSTARSHELDRRRSTLARYEQHTIEVVVDRLVRAAGIERRLTDSLETALRLAEGVAEVEIVPAGRRGGRGRRRSRSPSTSPARTCGLSFDELAPRNFSFNSPYGACEHCDGLGTRFEVDPELVVPDDDLSIARGRDRAVGRRSAASTSTGCSRRWPRSTSFPTDTPWTKLTAKQQKVVLYGTGDDQVHVRYRNRYGRAALLPRRSYEGVVPWLERRHTEAESDAPREQIEGYMREVPCPACGGARLQAARRSAVTIDGHNIYELGELSIREAAERPRRRSSCPSATG